jgi:serpin B
MGLSGATLALLAAVGCGSSNQPAGTGTGGTGGGSGADIARSSLQHEKNPQVADPDYQSLLTGNSDFAFDLYSQLTQSDDGNVIMSPISATVALAMTYAGAKGDTATQMAQAMHFDLPQEKLHPALNKLAMALASENIAPHKTDEGDKSLRLDLVNASWAQKDYQFNAPYLDTLAVSYDAGVHLLDFASDPDGSRQIINGWVSDNTEGRIKNLIGKDAIDPTTRLVLTNALYFYGSWVYPFDKTFTADAAFHPLSGSDVTVSTMHQTETLSYAEGTNYQVVDLPYDGGAVSMRIVLPAQGHFNEIRKGLSTSWMQGVDKAMQGSEVSVSLPKFKFEWGSTSLKPALQALGMKDAFEFPAADFSGMEPKRELYVGDVLQKAFVGVDESGTEAAAATAVIMNAGGMPVQPKDFNADHSFIFFIRDSSGTLLFVGQVTNPAG